MVGILLSCCVVFLSGCDPEIEKQNVDGVFFPGNADYSQFVALGGGQLGGQSNYELYRSGQLNSIASILGERFQSVGGGRFESPLMLDELGFGNRTEMKFRTDCEGEQELKALSVGGVPDAGNELNIGDRAGYNNFGIPDLTVARLFSSNSRNDYYERMQTPGTANIAEDFLSTPRSFFLFWLGQSDISRYALSGDGNFSFINIPEVEDFEANLEEMIRRATVNGERGILVNVPNILEYPHFTQIPFDGLVLSAEEAAQLNIYYLIRNPSYEFKEGKNPFIIDDGLPILNSRQMFSDELIPITINTDSLKCESYGGRLPIDDGDVLSRDEIAEIREKTNAYNEVIARLSERYGLPMFDINTYMHNFILNGITVEGITYTASYPSGGMFSSDGIYFTPRGNAIIANEIIEVLNGFYNSKIPLVNVNDFETLPLP